MDSEQYKGTQNKNQSMQCEASETQNISTLNNQFSELMKQDYEKKLFTNTSNLFFQQDLYQVENKHIRKEASFYFPRLGIMPQPKKPLRDQYPLRKPIATNPEFQYARKLTKEELRTSIRCRQYYPGIVVRSQFYEKYKNNIDIGYLFQLESNQATYMELFDKIQQEIQAIIDETQKRLGVNLIQFGLDDQKEHECKYCGKKYEKQQALGGHISKMHPQQSRIQKQQTKLPKRKMIKPFCKKTKNEHREKQDLVV